MSTIMTLPMRTTTAITDDGTRCILCDKLWPTDQLPLFHTYLMSATEPVAHCHCDSTHTEPRWHAFQVLNSHGSLVAAGIVCPPCIVDKGLEAGMLAALIKAMNADRNAN